MLRLALVDPDELIPAGHRLGDEKPIVERRQELAQLEQVGLQVRTEDVERIWPLGFQHINMLVATRSICLNNSRVASCVRCVTQAFPLRRTSSSRSLPTKDRSVTFNQVFLSQRQLTAGLDARIDYSGLVDVVLAAREAYPGQLSTRWFAVGHSGGGHAALESAEVADTGYGKDLNLLGTIPIEPAGNFTALLGETGRNPDGPQRDHVDASGYVDVGAGLGSRAARGIYLALLVGLKEARPATQLSDYLGPQSLQWFASLYCESNAAVAAAVSDLAASEFGPRTDAAWDAWRNWLVTIAVPRRRFTAPVFYPAGENQAKLSYVKLCHARCVELGNTTLLKLYPGVDHHTMLPAAASDVIQWMRDRLAGHPAPSN